ncbi:hypothetical protein ACOTE4_24645 [Achromobacter xylosoxidans]|uniref:hypothetical protein n=1 Tax=Alcaligenes xylosoxydans xylosoxydans TaxID=85698 RepID=UPI001F1495C0|nr:hypothetical protein [Achromobacter xylosoxidans]
MAPACIAGAPWSNAWRACATPTCPPAGVRYTRAVTRVWCGFFAINGTVAAMLAAWGPWSWWTAYNGAISYVLMGLLMGAEWLLRPAAAKAA